MNNNNKQFQINMKDFQPRLSELISPNDIKAKRRGSLYILNNSIKRNTLNSFAPIRREEMGYDCKLPQMSLKRRDMAKMLDLVLSKEEKNLPDRNFLRRILVQIFDEDLIHSGSRNFINHLSLLKQKVDDVVIPEERLFYFILKGAATVKSGGFVYAVEEGNTFGEKELLAGLDIQEIVYSEHTLMVTLNQVNFDNYFRYYFQKRYHEKMMEVQCIREKYLVEIPLFNQFCFFDHILYEIFNPGDKIVQKGKTVNRIYFVGDSWKGDRLSNFSHGCFGLKEIMKNKDVYIQSAYSMDLGYRVPYVEKEIFIKYVKNFLMMASSGLMGRCSIRTTGMGANPEEKQSILKKMNVKKVRIHSKLRKMATEPLETIISDFKFFSNCQVEPMTSPKYHKMLEDLSKERKGNSLSIHLKPNRKILF